MKYAVRLESGELIGHVSAEPGQTHLRLFKKYPAMSGWVESVSPIKPEDSFVVSVKTWRDVVSHGFIDTPSICTSFDEDFWKNVQGFQAVGT